MLLTGKLGRVNMKNIYEELVDQLNTLVPFLALAHENIFTVIRDQAGDWFPEELPQHLPDTYELYRGQISQAAFLLGFSYFEAFLSNLVSQIFQKQFNMLPSKRQLNYEDILGCKNYNEIIELMVKRELTDLFYKSTSDQISFLKERLSLAIHNSNDEHEFIKASLVRNCFMHNSSRVDQRLSKHTGEKLNAIIFLDPNAVHQFGIIARRVGKDFYTQAVTKHLSRKTAI